MARVAQEILVSWTPDRVVLFADSVDLDTYRTWTEVAVGRPSGDGVEFPEVLFGDRVPIRITRFHPGAYEYEGPAPRRRLTASAPGVAELDVRLTAEISASDLPPQLFRWYNRLGTGWGRSEAQDLEVGPAWRAEPDAFWLGCRYRYEGVDAILR